MSKKKKTEKPLPPRKPPAATDEATPSGGGMHALRETIESIVIAFVLAFLFRTFEAEAFVIPTGSMSPSLLGQHIDADCSECGYRFRTTASEEEGEGRQAAIANLRYTQQQIREIKNVFNRSNSPIQRSQLENELQTQQLKAKEQKAIVDGYDTVAGLCPMCRQPMLFRDDNLPANRPSAFESEPIEQKSSYPGDRILVNKYGYASHDPERWDVVVFKFPGNGEMNYIKRLVGLPNETLRVLHGDLFVRPEQPGADFRIERKPPTKLRAMLQEVHDTEHDPAVLFQAGWPLRWEAEANDGWQIDAKPIGQVVQQKYQIDGSDSSEIHWLQYRHFVPSEYDWGIARKFRRHGKHQGIPREQWIDETRPELISDFNAYNARILRGQLQYGLWQFQPHQLGTQWVGDLAVACEIDIQQPKGELVLALVEGGKLFSCRIDLSTGSARLEIEGDAQFQPTAETELHTKGSCELLFANVDDQLLLWIDGDLVEFGDTTYDAERLYGNRENILPKTSDADPGDLAPVRIGAQGAALAIERLSVFRDIYYVAAKWDDPQIPSHLNRGMSYYADYPNPAESEMLPDGTRLEPIRNLRELFRNPNYWSRFATRQSVEFPIAEKQYFVMGDNSPESQDCRLWLQSPGIKGTPGGAYLDERLLTGRAVCVFWPHSWGAIPGLPQLPGFPNFGDMRLVR